MVVARVKTTLRNVAIHIKIILSIVRVDIITLYYSVNFQVPRKVNARGKPIAEQKYHLETFDTEVTSKGLPLAYSFAKHNDHITNILPYP